MDYGPSIYVEDNGLGPRSAIEKEHDMNMNMNRNIFVPFGQPTPISYCFIAAEAARSLEEELRSNRSETVTIDAKRPPMRRFGRREAFAEAK